MKQRVRLLAVAGLSLCTVFCARAQSAAYVDTEEKVYVRAGLGPVFVQDNRLVEFGGPDRADVEYNVGVAASAAVGWQFMRDFAAEFEFGGMTAEIESAEGYYSYDSYLGHMPFMLNLVYSRERSGSRITPHVGAGLGGAITLFDTDGFGNGGAVVFGEESDAVFVWQVFGGARIELVPDVALDLSYRYFWADESSFSYPPAHPWFGPHLRVGFSGIRAHMLIASVLIKF
ncbi:MAG: porin family protein [Verrucomicrobiae bacterium]|nr:porin family protein [Verrucomicrobiae bacterium]